MIICLAIQCVSSANFHIQIQQAAISLRERGNKIAFKFRVCLNVQFCCCCCNHFE